jgi:hypothetical protein
LLECPHPETIDREEFIPLHDIGEIKPARISMKVEW